MKKNSILITLLFFLLISCGYQPILLNKKNNFNIEKIELIKKNRLNKFIKNNLNSISNNDAERKISLKIDSTKTKITTSKDSKGNSQILKMTLSVDVRVYEKNEMKSKKTFFESFSYSNNSNKFYLSKYERNIEKKFRDKIIKNITIYLISF